MPTIAEVRQQYPQYSDMSDADLAGALHKKFYSDMPEEQFNQKIGLSAAPAEKPPEKPRNWSDVPLEAVTNIPSSAAHLVGGIVEQQKNAAGYALPKIAQHGLLAPVAMGADLAQKIYSDPGIVKRLGAGVWNSLVDRYGSEEALKKTIATDPVGFAMDAAMVIQPAASGVSRGARAVSEIGRAADVSKPFYDIPRGAEIAPPVAVAPPTMGTGPSGAEAGAAMQGLREAGIDVNVPRAITSDNTAVQRTGQGLSHTPIVGDPLAKVIHDTLPAEIRQGRDVLADRLGRANEADAAGRATGVLSDAAAAEAKLAETAAGLRNTEEMTAWERAQADREARVASHVAESGGSVEARTGRVNPNDTGALATQAFRDAEEAAKAKKNRLYDVAGETPGVIKSEGVGGLHGRIKGDLETSDVFIDYPGTAKTFGTTNDMMRAVKDFEGGLYPGAPIVKAEAAAPKAAGATAEAASKAQSLTEFLASKGGLGPDAELGAIGADRHVVDVGGIGKRRLVKQGGSTLDYAREAAEEAGYLPKGSTPNDLLDVLDAEMRGNKRYPQGLEGTQTSREAAAAAESSRAEHSAFRRGLENDLKDAGHDQLGSQVKQRTLKIMEDERLSPDDAVEKAIRQLDNEASNARHGPEGDFPGDRPIPAEGISVQGMHRFRKGLRKIASGAERGSEDERAAKKVIDAYDAWTEEAMQKHLLSGDPKALEKFQAANKANREWRQDFGYNEKRDVNNLAQKVLHQDVTPQEVASYLIGSGKIGKQGTTSRLYTMLMKATGDNPELAQSIQGAIWENLSSGKNAAADIREFVHKSGRDLAEKVFPEGTRDLMLRHADILDKAKTALEMSADMAKGTKPKPVEVIPGPMQQLAKRIIGGKMGKDEALWKTIEGYTKEGGDVKALAGLLKDLPPDMKGDIAGSVVRGLGKDHSGNFSLDIFASDWGNVQPRAKAVLFADAHSKALDELATIAQRLKDVKKKYGNSSGTAQTAAFQKLAAMVAAIGTGAVSIPLAVGGVVLGGAGNVGARILARPASASSLAKYAKALEQQVKSPTPSNQALVSMTERNLANTVKTLGTGVQAQRALAPRAQNEQRR